ncbi:MAG: DUF4372 domain-containing protein [Bacteroidota bacterium]
MTLPLQPDFRTLHSLQHKGNYNVKKFSCCYQFRCMSFASSL